MKKWDYDRLSSLLQLVIDGAGGLVADLDSSTAETFDLSAVLVRVEDLDRNVNSVKTLLRRERSKRA